MSEKKIFVIDTNVILHDHRAIYNFQENDVVIPIVVLEEVDKFKHGTDPINFQARQFVRILDDIVGHDHFNGGLSLGIGKGKLFIQSGVPYPEVMKSSFAEDIPDHRILAICDFVKQKHLDRKTIFVSKDVNLRMKAKSLKFDAEDYKNDKVANLEVLYQGIRTIKNVEDSKINHLYQDNHLNPDDVDKHLSPFANEFFILQGPSKSALTHYNPFSKRLERVDKSMTFGIKPRNAEQTLSMHALLNPEIKLISLTGKAGTGKTLLALAAALQQNATYDNIFLARPIVALSNRDLGFLPGDAKEKISPYMAPLYDNLGVIKRSLTLNSGDYKTLEEMQRSERLQLIPLAYIRGRSLTNTFFIIDEAQNLTPHEVKTIITRAGDGTKIVLTGDIQQIDSPYLDQQSNGLAFLTDRMKNQDIFAHINLVKGERSYLAELASDLL